jgi:hypothetical protein
MVALTRVIKDQSIFNTEEQLYIRNSKLLVQVLQKLELEYLYEPILHHGQLNSISKSLLNGKRLSEVQILKLAYCYGRSNTVRNDYTALIEEITDKKISARELVVYPFATQYKSQVMDTKSLEIVPDPKEFSKFFINLRM